MGAWRGTARTWFEPGVPGNDAAFEAQARSVAGGLLTLIEYDSTIEGARLDGVLLVGRDPSSGETTIEWADTFHQPSVMHLRGEPTDPGEPGAPLSALGSYEAPEGPPWGWRIEVSLEDEDATLAIRHFNVPPGGEPGLGVEFVASRVEG